jgi:hypothetical protein
MNTLAFALNALATVCVCCWCVAVAFGGLEVACRTQDSGFANSNRSNVLNLRHVKEHFFTHVFPTLLIDGSAGKRLPERVLVDESGLS